MSNSPLVTPVAEIKQKLQTLLEKGHLDEYFVEQILDYSLFFRQNNTK